MDLSEQFNSSVNQVFSIVESNKVLSTILGLFLILYASLAAPILPMSVTKIFRNKWFKLAFMFLIAYMATKDPSVAIISAVALLVTLQTLSAQETTNAVIRAVEKKVDKNIEAFGDVEPAISTNDYDQISDYSAPFQNYEILPKEAVTPSESDRQRQLEATQYVLKDQSNMVFVSENGAQMDAQPTTQMDAQPTTEMDTQPATQMDTQPATQMDTQPVEENDMITETQQNEEPNIITSTIDNIQSFMKQQNLIDSISGFENVRNMVQPYAGEINYEISSKNNNGMETFVNDNEESEKTELITGTCGDATAATDIPGFQDGEFATF